jgi:hypothetical protein
MSILVNSKLHYCFLLWFLLVCNLLAAANDNGCCFGHHCPRQASDSIKIHESINCFDGGLGTSICKVAHPSGGLDSLNPHYWRAGRLHHHGGGVCYLFVLLWMDSWRHETIVCQKVRENNPKVGLWVSQSGPPRLHHTQTKMIVGSLWEYWNT